MGILIYTKKIMHHVLFRVWLTKFNRKAFSSIWTQMTHSFLMDDHYPVVHLYHIVFKSLAHR